MLWRVDPNFKRIIELICNSGARVSEILHVDSSDTEECRLLSKAHATLVRISPQSCTSNQYITRSKPVQRILEVHLKSLPNHLLRTRSTC